MSVFDPKLSSALTRHYSHQLSPPLADTVANNTLERLSLNICAQLYIACISVNTGPYLQSWKNTELSRNLKKYEGIPEQIRIY